MELQESIEEISRLLYSDITTPANLLDNLRKPEYESISYYKSGSKFVCDLVAKDPRQERVLYRYLFDKDERLLTIEKLSNGVAEPMFSRDQELERATRNAIQYWPHLIGG